MSGLDRELIVVGAGPAGLATAIAASQAALDYEVLEKGVLVNSIFHFPRHMTFFTTPELLEIGGLPFVTPNEKPTQLEALRYYRRVADAYHLRMRLDCAVTALEPRGAGLAVHVRSGGRDSVELARCVVLATGYYDHPNRLGVPGEDLPHVSHYYDDPHAFYRKRAVVVGGKNSAAIAALELYRAGASVTLVHRGAALSDSVKYWIKPDIENRIREGSIQARFSTRLLEVLPDRVVVEGEGGRSELPADGVFLLTGYHPDLELLRGVGVRVEPESLKPEHDPASFETNVPGLYVAGAVVSGRETNRIFIENGRFHGEAIVAAIRKRLAAG
jgi:bacillithiol disulfide reductase